MIVLLLTIGILFVVSGALFLMSALVLGRRADEMAEQWMAEIE